MDRYVPESRPNGRPPPFKFGMPSQSNNARAGAGNNYRPAENRPGDFSFRMQGDRPAPRFSRELPPSRSLPPRGSRQGVTNGSSRNDVRPPSKGRRGGRGGRVGRPYQPRPATSDRPLLITKREPTPEQMPGMNEGDAKFKAVEDMSVSDEEEMELESDQQSDQEEHGSDGPPRKKTQSTSEGKADGKLVPKWSNPDPYTVLPPVDESHAKRKDVVRLIRKAKASAPDHTAKAADGDDFISFGDVNDVSSESSSDSEDESDNAGVPSGPKFSHLNKLHPDRTASNGFKTLTASELGPPPAPPPDVKDALDIDIWPPPPKASSKKRGHDEYVEDLPISDPGPKRKKGALKGAGTVAPEWRAKAGANHTPWYTVDHSRTGSAAIRLHKEICDFYEFVRPQDFESAIRHDLVRRVQAFLNRDYKREGAEVAYFGSFAAGLYLPDADMDLVVRSREWRAGGEPSIGYSKKTVYKFGDAIKRSFLAKDNSVVCITGAKVPIVKYVDKVTGLKVDISFENDTGIVANRTYDVWKSDYPALPILVSLVKQFLLMRGLNEVHSGGLGGFSTTCLVVHLMMMMPQIQNRSMDPMQNLGEIFMEFLDFYGNRFNSTTTGIEMKPPRYFQKRHYSHIRFDNGAPYKLCIIDPNRDDNDISGGTRNIRIIFDAFSDAFATLRGQMSDIHTGKGARFGSILSSLYAGDYHSFETQRARLKRLYTEK